MGRLLNDVLDDVLAQGFDLSYIADDEDEDGELTGGRYVRLKCSRCAACSINGVACHETGCPNLVRERFSEDEWGGDE